MKAYFKPSKLSGIVNAPSSKSVSHRYLIAASLVKETSTIKNVLFCEDINATIECLRSLGSIITIGENEVYVNGANFLSNPNEDLFVNESGSTFRFLLPLTLLCYRDIKFHGTNKLIDNIANIYEELCFEKNFVYEKHPEYILVNGGLNKGKYEIKGNINSQYVCGLIFALAFHNQESEINITTSILSEGYLDLTIKTLNTFGFNIEKVENSIFIHPSTPHKENVEVEADESSCANIDAFNYLNNEIIINGLNPNTIQESKVYHRDFELISSGKYEIDIEDCIELAPIYMSLAALKKGVILKNANRFISRGNNRLTYMKMELSKVGAQVIINDDSVEVISHPITLTNFKFEGHNDHRIVMALSLILNKYGGSITDCECVNKGFPHFFEKLKQLNADIDFID